MPESELRFGNGKRFKYDHVLRFTASSHLHATRWTCYSTQTWQQNTWQGSTHDAWQKMNTELRTIHPLTGSNNHGKSANGNQISDLVKLTLVWNFRSDSTLWRNKTICYRTWTWQSKAWHGATQRAYQKSLSDLEPKGIRKIQWQGCEHSKNIISFQT